jgi:predicted nucleotidyltransferase
MGRIASRLARTGNRQEQEQMVSSLKDFPPRIRVQRERLERFCEKWGLAELALFGSVLRDDFGPGSDVDVLVSVKAGVRLDWRDWLAMEEELKALFEREVDLVEKEGIRNPFRRHAIISSMRVIYDRRAG